MIKQCVVCGGEFEAVASDGRTGTRIIACSPECKHERRLSMLKTWRDKRRTVHACIICGGEVHRGGKALTCSEECSRERRQRVAKEGNRRNYLKNRAARIEYCRKWREQNPDMVREASRLYSAKNRETIRARERLRREANQEQEIARNRRRRAEASAALKLIREIETKGLEALL